MGKKNHRYGKPAWNRGKKVSDITLEKIKNNRANQTFPYKDTSIEIIIQNELTKLGIPFEKHKPFRIRDFYHQADIFIKPNIIIECDGEAWHTRLLNNRNKARYIPIQRHFIIDSELETQGMKVIRLCEYDIESNLNWCMNIIQTQHCNKQQHSYL